MTRPPTTRDPGAETYGYALQKAQSVTAPEHFPLRAIIEQHRDVLTPLCGPGVELERVIAQVWIASRKEPKLLRATPTSLIPAISRALEVGGVIGRDVHLLVFGTEAVDCVGYMFMVELIVAAGGARSIDARCVYEGETYEPVYGTNPHIVHRPTPFGVKRGKLLGAYAVAHFGQQHQPKFVEMRLEEIEVVRAKSQSWAKLRECPDWYAMKTAIRRLAKLLPKNPKLASVLSRLDAAERPHEAVEEAEWSESAPEPRPETVSPDGEDLTYERMDPDEPPDDETVTVDLATAKAVVIGKRTVDSRTDVELVKLYEWCGQQANASPAPRKFIEYMAAIATVQAARLPEPAKAAKEAA